MTDYGRSFAAWREAAGAWDDYVRHPFVQGLGDGTLPRQGFLRYLVQDYRFLIHFSRAWALGAAKAGTLRRNFQGYTDDTAPVLVGLGASSISRFPQGYAQNASATAACAPPMPTVSRRQPRARAHCPASSSEWSLVKADGSITQRTFSGPSASAAIAATIAESMPPDRPSNAFLNPVLAK